MAEQGEEETMSSGDGGANPPLDKLLFSDGGENACSKLAAEIEDLERSSGKRPIDGRPGMAGERGGAGGGQASIRVGASRRSLIGGGKKLGVSNCSSPSFYSSSLRSWADADTWFERQQQEEEMQKLQVENQVAMQAAEDLHRKKQLDEREGEKDETDDPMARAEAEV
ncbi:hypothetical protein LINPERPRIM_LOCUS11682 [Linum perenne]